jgi:hypothetical protein
MDDQNQNPENQQPTAPQPISPPSASVGTKVIQPTDAILQAIKSQNENPVQNLVQPTVNPQTDQQLNNSSDGYSVPVLKSVSEKGLNDTDKKSKRGWIKYILLGCGALVALIVIWGFVQFFSKGAKSTLYPYTVSQSSPPFTVNFYKGATVEQKNNNTYLITSNSHGGQAAIWILTLQTSASCSIDGQIPFSFQFNGQSTGGCYKSNKQVYAADVQVNGQTYQLDLASSNSPLSINDAIDIFSSVKIQ